MSDARITAGRKLAADLNAIRTENGVSVKDVMDATRLAENIVEELEQTGLVSNPMFNRVYLRSIFRSYARAVGLEEDRALSALEEALGGTYAGSLRLHTGKKGGSEQGDDTPPPEEVLDHEAGEDNVAAARPAATPTSKPSAHPDPASPASRVVLLPNLRGMWAAGIAALVLLALVALALMWVFSKSDLAETGIDTESGSIDMPQQIDPPATPEPTLPDTLRIGVTATVEPLDPIRVTLDMRQEILIPSAVDTVVLPIEPLVRFPLWVEMDSTVVFQFLQMAQFEREVDHATITVEGHVLPPDWVDEQGVYTVHRDSVLAWLMRLSDVP